ncbi:MAG: hypothetical protein DRJ10_13400 [Bacteroidetes bacterium]|nr:MAG: hypothetical protein DRJ10_13400 [Bacteroidota bacterium]
MKILTYILVAIVITFVSYGFLKDEKSIKEQKNVSSSETSSVTGKELYKANCASCHRVDLKGNPPTFPGLNKISAKMKKSEALYLIKTGKNVMPSFAHLSEQERNAIVGFLYGENAVSTVKTTVTAKQLGQNLFVANCASCHKTKHSEPQPKGQQDRGRTPAVLGGIDNDINQTQFNKILNMGPCYMPSFSHLKETEKEAIYKYLSSIEIPKHKKTNNKRMCGMKNCNCMN